jgi:hypothetical protein
MATTRSTSYSQRPIKSILVAAVLLYGHGLSLMAEPAKSLLPAFGNEGAEFTTKGENGHIVKGWLPVGWKDDTAWAPVSAFTPEMDFEAFLMFVVGETGAVDLAGVVMQEKP